MSALNARHPPHLAGDDAFDWIRTCALSDTLTKSRTILPSQALVFCDEAAGGTSSKESRMRATHLIAICGLLLLATGLPTVCAQTTPSTPEPDEDDVFVVRDSDVGYIDSAVPGDVLRLRFDDGWGLNRPNRAEFFYARPRPAGPGLPVPESNIDYQDLTAHLERRFGDRTSVFAELGSRFLNPEVNDNSAGLADMNAGFKHALISGADSLLTAQLRVYAPTGDVSRGLGTGHASLEPGLLFMTRLNSEWTLSSELRYWIPVGGTDFAGDVIRYGAGIQYGAEDGLFAMVHPVVELVGWTVLEGKQAFLVAPSTVVIEDAAGDTIVNIKAGTRTALTPVSDLYVGYGHSLTGDRWYENILRAELRWTY